MSKKQMSKKKIGIKLTAGDTAVVLTYEQFLHIAETYDYLATEQDNEQDAQAFRDIADTIRYQSNENYFHSEDEYEEW